jgi:hypothetical protein
MGKNTSKKTTLCVKGKKTSNTGVLSFSQEMAKTEVKE